MSEVSQRAAVAAIVGYVGRGMTHDGDSATALARWRASLSTDRTDRTRRAVNNCNCSSNACVSQDRRDGVNLWIELVEGCNLNCTFCYNPWRATVPTGTIGSRLEFDVLADFIGTVAATLDIAHVTLSGGEPLLYPELDALLDVLGPVGAEIGITTNGRSLTFRRAERLYAKGVHHASVPLHSSIPAIHDRLSGGSSWHASLRAIAAALDTGMTVSPSALVTAANTETVPDAVRIAVEIGADVFVLNGFHEAGQGKDMAGLQIPEDVFSALSAEVREAVGDEIDVVVGSPRTVASTDHIGRRIAVSPAGDVKLCNQSSSGVLNLSAPDAEETLNRLLSDLRSHDIEDYVGLIDSCTCLGT